MESKREELKKTISKRDELLKELDLWIRKDVKFLDANGFTSKEIMERIEVIRGLIEVENQKVSSESIDILDSNFKWIN